MLPLTIPGPPEAPLHRRLTARVLAGADQLMLAGLRRMMLGLPPGPVTAAELDAVLAELSRYNDPAILADPDRLLAPPAALPRLAVLERRPLAGGRASHYSFPSAYVPLHPGYAREYAGYDRLPDVHVHAWEHATPAPASIILVHGWAVGARRLHEIEFSIPALFRDLGLDVYFFVQPFHGERKPSQVRFSGQLHPSTDLVRTNEAFIQTCIDLRTLIGVIGERRANRIGMMGSSLGGYTSALLASIDPRLDFVVPIMAPASMAHLMWDHGAGDPFRRRVEGAGMTRDRFHQAWALHSPLSYQPRVPWERRLIVGAADDVLVRPSDVDILWEHWQRPRRFTFAGGHILQLGRRAYIRELASFLTELGVIAPVLTPQPSPTLARLRATLGR